MSVSADISVTGRVQALVDAAACRGERLVCLCRIPFCVLILVRYLAVEVPYTFRLRIANLSIVGIAIVFSLVSLERLRRGLATRLLLRVSMILDPAVCLLSLLQTMLIAGHPPYTGLLTHPDPAALLVVVFAAGFRLDPRMAACSGIGSCLATAGLFWWEHRLHGPELTDHGDMRAFFFIMLGASVALSVSVAARTLALARAAARDATRVERGREAFMRLMHDQHDARGLLSTASVQMDRVIESLGPGPDKQIARLRDDLKEATRLVTSVGEGAFGQQAWLGEVAIGRANVGEAVTQAVGGTRLRFPGLVVHLPPSGDALDGPLVDVVGGQVALARMLANLLANAAEGDGRRGGRQAWIESRPSGAGWEVEVRDDGPGFPAIVASDGLAGFTTKTGGIGLGLQGISGLVELSGGNLTVANHVAGGAVVTLRFTESGSR